jgi:polyribonucleotide nucleotidyltransferase
LISKVEVVIESRLIVFETGKLARQADGAVLVSSGGTNVLVTVVASKEVAEGKDFFPMTVDVEERMYAAGKIPGGFIKREGRPSEKSILTARLIDRPLRPLFKDSFRNELQIVATILSVDMVNPFDVLAVNGASAALCISDVPYDEPIGAVRLAKNDEGWIINPTFEEIENSRIDIVVSGTRDAIMMVESEAADASEDEIIEALELARNPINQMIDAQLKLKDMCGKPKREMVRRVIPDEVRQKVRQLTEGELRQALRVVEKSERERRIDEITEKAVEDLASDLISEQDIKDSIFEIQKNIVRENIIKEKVRVDGRKPDEIRQISCEVGLFPRTHGSGLFTRGQTQVLTVLTLGAIGEEQVLDGLGVEESKRFIHHYNFPPFSTGETGAMRGPKRREIGHGALVERALLNMIPPEDEFPYTLRLVSEVLESNGSTSMASVCGSTLALMDAGVEIKSPVAGIAMGLVKEDYDYEILSDIQGIEDFCGDMDFKVAGTNHGITALQMDIKVKGMGLDIIRNALERAKAGRLYILDKMLEVIGKPRSSLSDYAPRVVTMVIPQDKIGEVIGPGGKTIKKIIEETGVKIDIEDDGRVFITSPDQNSAEKARQKIASMTQEIAIGQIYLGTVINVTSFGAFVELQPGRDGLVHISKLSKNRISKVEDVVNVGDKILVRVADIDPRNRINLEVIDINPKA